MHFAANQYLIAETIPTVHQSADSLTLAMKVRPDGHLADIPDSICQENSSIFKGSPSILANHLADVVARARSIILSCPHEWQLAEAQLTSNRIDLNTLRRGGYQWQRDISCD
jgi:hypothetical protein